MSKRAKETVKERKKEKTIDILNLNLLFIFLSFIFLFQRRLFPLLTTIL